MRATGLEKGGIYRHFESKEELAGDAFDYAWKVAMDARFEGTEEIPNTVDRLKQIVRNFRDRRTGLVPGGCPLLNTAIDGDYSGLGRFWSRSPLVSDPQPYPHREDGSQD